MGRRRSERSRNIGFIPVRDKSLLSFSKSANWLRSLHGLLFVGYRKVLRVGEAVVTGSCL